jgi:phosphoglucomutase
LPHDKIVALRDRLRVNPPTRLAGIPVRRIVEVDGHKFIMTDGSWMGIRLSGTEPVVRVYLEANAPEELTILGKAGKALAGAA